MIARRVAVRVTPDALRQVRAGHPWVFDRSILGVKPAAGAASAEPGDLAVIFDAHGRFAAIGLFDPTSPVRVRILHVGDPRAIDSSFWRERLSSAIGARAPLIADTTTTACRLVHGENDLLPGLVVDRYDDVLVVKLYSLAWLAHLDPVVDVLTELLEPRSIVLRLARVVARASSGGPDDGSIIAGEALAGPVHFLEHGLGFDADVVNGQKTGHFLDQRDNRRLVRSLARGVDVLDVFCSTGGFSVHAAAGGARSVHSVDLSPHAIRATRLHMAANAGPIGWHGEHHATTGDAFEVMAGLARAGRRYGLVVVDPPSFASSAPQVGRALDAYGALTTGALGLMDSGILVQASCSSRVSAEDFAAAVLGAARRAGRGVDEIERTGHPLDHPVGFVHGAYLKAMFLRVR